MVTKHKTGYSLIILSGLLAIVTLLLSNPIAQDLGYHSFADERSVFGIQNFWNVVSNVPFFVVGLLGMYYLRNKNKGNSQLGVFFIGVALVAFGSGYYHYEPNNNTLVWDRLPMTIAFMGLFSFVISDYLNQRIGKILLVPLLVLGLISIMYWAVFDDLRIYVFVQFFPILVIPIVLLFFRKDDSKNKAFWILLIFYLAAKLFEHYDFQSYENMNSIGGHSLKHILAAIGIYFFCRYYFRDAKNQKAYEQSHK